MAEAIQWITRRGSLRSLSRWLFLATLIAAPWFHGVTTAWSIEVINGLLGLVFAFWIASLVVDRRWPMVPRALFVVAGTIIFLGGWMTLNAHAVYDSGFRVFVPIVPLARKLPGSADYALSFTTMVRVSALIGIILLAAEMTQRGRWLVRLWWSVAISGGSIALLGLLQKAGRAPMIFWHPADPAAHYTSTFFASFYYHANAGAFLNLVLPPTAGLAVWVWSRRSRPWIQAACLATLLLVVLAIVSNTSRMAQLLGAGLVIAVAATFARSAIWSLGKLERKTLIFASLVVMLTIVAVAQAVHLDQPLRRWQSFSEQLPRDARWLATRAGLRAAGDAGIFGFGPGSFRAIYPHYQAEIPDLSGTWRFLHEDYLQTLLEWGWLGALALGSLFFGGIAYAARNYRRGAENWSHRQRIFLLSTLLALGGVAVHAAVDFPLQIYSIQILVATYLGVCCGSGAWGKEEGTGRN